NAVTLTSVSTANGPITITTGGATIIGLITSSTDSDNNDVNLTASSGNITVGTVSAGTVSGDVTVQATTGSIADEANDSVTDITGDVVTLTAGSGIGASASSLDTAANSITASVTGAGLINLNEANAVTLTSVST